MDESSIQMHASDLWSRAVVHVASRRTGLPEALTAANSSALEICFTIVRGRRARVCRRGDDDQRSPWIDRAPSFMIFDSSRTHETYPMEL